MVDLDLNRSELEALLAEDAPWGDLTTAGLGLGHRPARIDFFARADLVVAGIRIARGLVEVAGGDAEVLVADGDPVPRGTPLLSARGPAGALHRAWKQAQTTLEILSGIASAAHALVEAAARGGRVVPVACTRKTLAGARRLQIGAIVAGGCIPHRLGLSETVLVFEEHRRFLPDVPLAEMAARLRRVAPEKKLVIEVASPEEAASAAAAGFDVIQLEKFAPAEIARTVALLADRHPRPVLAAAGGIGPDNAAAHVAAGADMIVTSWPYGARPRDVQVRLTPDD
ncbi:ModD protein [Siculibacillus lacustris]|uniref:Putative pyrophosphorylase ModD n=1 Tax=Siculibacillus lacustris TaxID=1549641 RepID=A0A4Q9VVM1_9HYPH|nr:ModD protein [Siculibacillus lacustris]TBW40312.1 ModD protein [Siculibacillus lacustris]